MVTFKAEHDASASNTNDSRTTLTVPQSNVENSNGTNTNTTITRPLPSSNSEDGVDDLSGLLLQGWRMLAETCPLPTCHMPLARSRSGRIVCCNCRAEVTTRRPSSSNTNVQNDLTEEQHTEEHENNRLTVSTQTNGTINGMSNATSESNENNIESTQGNNETNAPALATESSSRAMVTASATRVSRDAISAAMGEKLLSGWTMLSAACDRCGTPLMRDGSQNILCVGCDLSGTNVTSDNNPSTAVTNGRNGNEDEEHDDVDHTVSNINVSEGRLLQATRLNNSRNGNNRDEMNIGAQHVVDRWNGGRLIEDNSVRGYRAPVHGVSVGSRDLPRLAAGNTQIPRLGGGRRTDVPLLGHSTHRNDLAPPPTEAEQGSAIGFDINEEEIIRDATRLRNVIDLELNRSELSAAQSLRRLRIQLNEDNHDRPNRVRDICVAMKEVTELIFRTRTAREQTG